MLTLRSLTAVEIEGDGLLTYDRPRLKVWASRTAAANEGGSRPVPEDQSEG